MDMFGDPEVSAIMYTTEDVGRQLADRVREARQLLREAEENLITYRRWARRRAPVLNYEDTLDDVPELIAPGERQEPIMPHPAREPEVRLCVSCRSDFIDTDTYRCPCHHDWCQACVTERLEAAIRSTSMFPAACCGQPILPVYEAFVSFELWGRYQAKKIEVETPSPTYCSKRDCNRFVPPQNVNVDGQARCFCGQVTCIDCKAEWHTGRCAVDHSREALLTMAAQERWQRCIRCTELVERIDGCNEMTCVCGARFCYACGSRWKSCQCPQFGPNHGPHPRQHHLDRPRPHQPEGREDESEEEDEPEDIFSWEDIASELYFYNAFDG